VGFFSKPPNGDQRFTLDLCKAHFSSAVDSLLPYGSDLILEVTD
jgi:hypothetical protein